MENLEKALEKALKDIVFLEKALNKTSERTFEETSTWAVAVVCVVLLFISIVIERLIHKIGTWLKKKNKKELYEALEKVKAELMLLGFLSLLLTVAQKPITKICISDGIVSTMRPCSDQVYHERKQKEIEQREREKEKQGQRFLLELAESYIPRRSLATKGYDKCGEGKVAFVSAYAIHQLHVFIFVLAVTHVIYCVVTYALGNTKMRRWKTWEDEAKTIEHQYSNDPERFRFARDTTFGRRHLNFWSKTSVTRWIVCFFRQFFGSVTKVDYLTLRHGFVTRHVGQETETGYDFGNYIQRSLEIDFKNIVEISPAIWLAAVLFLLTNSNGLHSYLWLPFIPLVVILIVGTKLQVIITKMGVRIQEKGDVVRGVPVVQLSDDLFWFDSPKSMFFLIHLVLFTNAFQLAFFAWTTREFGIKSCFHGSNADISIRIIVGVVVQILCSYVTLPLYALVTQMGGKMKSTVFKEEVATALKKWHDTAKDQSKHGSSRPTTPPHGSSPTHLLHNLNNQSAESLPNSSSRSFTDHHHDPESQHQEPVPASMELTPIQTIQSSKEFTFKK